MDTFAFIIHPIDPKRDVGRKFPLLGRILSERQIDFFSTFFPPVFISEIEGIASEANSVDFPARARRHDPPVDQDAGDDQRQAGRRILEERREQVSDVATARPREGG